MVSPDTTSRFHTVAFPADATAGLAMDADGIRLSADPGGPLGAVSRDGSIGRVVLPVGCACDRRGVHFLVDAMTSHLLEFDPHAEIDLKRPFRPVVALGGLFPQNAPASRRDASRVPSSPWRIAVTDDTLLVVHRNHPALVVLARRTWNISDIVGPEHNGLLERAIDVAASGSREYLLTRRSSRVAATCAVHWRPAASSPWRELCELPDPPATYRRLVVDGNGEVFAWSAIHGAVPVHRPQSDRSALDAAAIPLPRVMSLTTPHGECAAAYVVAPLDRPGPTTQERVTRQIPVTPAMFAKQSIDNGFVITGDGRRLSQVEYRPARRRLFQTGLDDTADSRFVRVSDPVDSGQYRCVWDRLLVEADLSEGCGEVLIESFTSDNLAAASQSGWLRDDRWRQVCVLTSSGASPVSARAAAVDFPVRSDPGQYLWIRVRLKGDGFSTPIVRPPLVVGPRDSYVVHLPPVFREDTVSRDFLERFVGVFQREWDGLEARLSDPREMFDPSRVDAALLPQLAERLGIDLPPQWDRERQRRLMQALTGSTAAPEDRDGRQAPHPRESCSSCPGADRDRAEEQVTDDSRFSDTLLGRRGTGPAVKRELEAVIAAVTGLAREQLRGYPWIIEGYRERNRFWLPYGSAEAPGDDGPPDARLSDPASQDLWGRGAAERFRLGTSGRLGQHRLLPLQAPLFDQTVDLYRLYAHRIRVVVPSCWLKATMDRQAFRQVLEQAQPAHVASSVTLVEPGLCIGIQSTVGIDTILSDEVPVVLSETALPTFGLSPEVLSPTTFERPPPLAVGGRLSQHEI